MADRTKARILLVDDEPLIVKMVSKRLQVEGYEVMVAQDGQAALDRVRDDAPDLVILDIMLPKVNGYEVCRQLKHDAQCSRLPIILFTARAQEADEQTGRDAGADAYLRKPFKAQELLEHITALVHPQTVRQAPPG